MHCSLKINLWTLTLKLLLKNILQSYVASQLCWWSTWGRSQGFSFNSNFIFSNTNPLSDWRPCLLISFVLLRPLRLSSGTSWSVRRFLSTEYCFPVQIQSREHWWSVILAFQENGCWWNSSVIMTDAVTEWEDSLLLPATALVTPHIAFTQFHQLHQTHLKYVHIGKKPRLLASGKWVPLFAHSCLCSTMAITWNLKLLQFHVVLTPCCITQQKWSWITGQGWSYYHIPAVHSPHNLSQFWVYIQN